MRARHPSPAVPPPATPRTLSVVLPVFNEAASLRLLLPALALVLSEVGMKWEVVIVDDGGSDNLKEVVAEFESIVPVNLQLLTLSRNFGKEAALTAGLTAARGDAVAIMDGDGRHPASLIPRMVARWQAGCPVVIAVQTGQAREPRPLAWTKRAFYRFLQKGERFAIPPDAGDFRLLDRCVVDALLQLPERARFMKGLYAWLGFRSETIAFEAPTRIAGDTHFRLPQLLELASLGITSFSMKPLRMVSLLGVLISTGALLYGLFILMDTLIVGNAVSGWATLASGMMLLAGIQLMCLGVIAEYLGRVFEETKRRPLYIVERCLDHSTLRTQTARVARRR
ncbi:glycosyltransferase family 2 protein [Pseudoduganella violacea]|uniref:Glycosyltransferase involved in cell wall biosynthesis n=1 Tax=Pseudoduganella violacea TaxID=1715466 RepID=A0A7W5BEJ4_9BURK|nr:glycosyltransferase family 2 protein [Pseudoduganella violacea]MBB3121737.1 glycosyltransferase involved in cell wall biosynthesis [Pseudoduganella violacea]